MEWRIYTNSNTLVNAVETKLEVSTVWSNNKPISIEVSKVGDKGEKGDGVELLEQKLGNVDVDFLLHYNIAKIS